MDGPATTPPDDREFGDASRRTYLAEERTLLAWWRSGLGALAVAPAVGRLIPALIDASRAPFVALGVGFGVLGLALIVYGTVRDRAVARALAAGRFRVADRWVVSALTALMVVLAVATTIVVAVG